MMYPQKKMTTKTTKTSVSMIEPLEGRQMFSASPALDGVAALPAVQTTVATSDFSFTAKMNKSSPKLFTATGKVSVNDIPFYQR